MDDSMQYYEKIARSSDTKHLMRFICRFTAASDPLDVLGNDDPSAPDGVAPRTTIAVAAILHGWPDDHRTVADRQIGWCEAVLKGPLLNDRAAGRFADRHLRCFNVTGETLGEAQIAT